MFKRENLRKNFLRVKQNIDQNLGRAEKSEVLSEDQQENEKRVEVVKHVFQNISKKAAAVLQAQGTDNDKRLKKLPEYGLGAALIESAQALGGDTLLGSVCQLCGDCQQSLAKEQLEYETNIEAEFIAPLQNIYDVEIPSIMKFRKALNKSTLDMDSAKTRLNQAMRQSQVPGANMASAGAKVDVIREEYEEASVKVETIKDNLSIELCNFAAKESDQSYRMLLLLQAQANFHRKALEAIEACIPQIKQEIHNSPAKPCYGMPLEEHLRLMCRDIALVLEACILTLLETGMEEEGLFRIAGAAIKLKKLKACFDANTVDMEEFSTDPHTIAGALKQYLRELPEPLLTFALHDDFLKAASLPQDQRLQTLWTLINKLPKANYNNFRYLIKFLSKLAEKSDINKMKPSNIAIVIGPNLLWSEKNNAPNMLTTGTVSAIIEAIVTHADWFFAGAFDFHTTGHGSSPKPCREPGFAHNIKTHNVNSKVVKEKGDAGEDSPKKIEPDKGGNKEESTTQAKIVTVQQSEFPLQKSKAGEVKMSGEEEESSSDETNPFSEKYESKSSLDLECRVEKEKGDPGESLMSGGRRNGHCVESSSTNTGDYDNIMYTVNPLNPMYRSSTLSRTHPVAGSDTRRGSADNILNLGKRTSPPLPPSRPSRLSKKMSPVQSDHLPGYSCLSRSESQSSCSDTNQSVCSLNPTMHTPHQSKSRFVVGSTPNITSLPGSRMDEETYSGFQGPLWNRPSQKVNFNTLKRGSDPCITSPPPQFVVSSSQRPLKISRSQLGTPPKPGEAPRCNLHSQEEVSRSHQAGGSHAGQGHSHVDKSFHQDTYSTAFALTSLGAGTKSTDYLTRVRAMWDDRHQQQTPKADSPPPPKTTCAIASSDKLGKPDKVFGCLPNTCLLTTSAESAPPSCEASKVQIQPYACADQSG
ncbi:rho GTPase-activating protein 17-like isoform X1 [Physella acuta]|uniref:rho GTPase-activating protein 17-like isoform X1 n=1 Tax=Physella acuta TaxID=109671 RepID=UPI0027DE9B07|nr:rho GTPase-activating protein 17-like isoform X1 [Physella acuta]